MAEDGSSGLFGWIHGDWKLVVGATGMVAPDFDGAKDLMFSVSPIISLGKAGPEARFTSRDDNISISLFDNGAIRAGLNGKILFARDEDDSDALRGLDPVRWGGELGGFAEFYPTDWLRVRGEVRQGIRTHDGVVAELRADAFHDVTPAIRISGGPRLMVASADYFDTYYGVTPSESVASGLAEYDPGGGVGVGRRRRRDRLEDDRPVHDQPVRRVSAPRRTGRGFKPRRGARLGQPVHLRRLGILPVRFHDVMRRPVRAVHV